MDLPIYTRRRHACIVLAAVAAAGCGKTSNVVPVHGIVLLDGTPLSMGTISFMPDQGRSSTSKIAPDGTFDLQTFGNKDGAPPGKYRVAIVAIESQGPVSEDTPMKSLIPQHYGNPATSGLEFEVTAGGNNEAKFKLSSKAKPKK